METWFAEIAAKPSQPAPVATQDGWSNGAAAMAHFSAVSASRNVMAKPSCRKAHDMLKEQDPAIGKTSNEGPQAAD